MNGTLETWRCVRLWCWGSVRFPRVESVPLTNLDLLVQALEHSNGTDGTAKPPFSETLEIVITKH